MRGVLVALRAGVILCYHLAGAAKLEALELVKPAHCGILRPDLDYICYLFCHLPQIVRLFRISLGPSAQLLLLKTSNR